jgi:hypothetical protein
MAPRPEKKRRDRGRSLRLESGEVASTSSCLVNVRISVLYPHSAYTLVLETIAMYESHHSSENLYREDNSQPHNESDPEPDDDPMDNENMDQVNNGCMHPYLSLIISLNYVQMVQVHSMMIKGFNMRLFLPFQRRELRQMVEHLWKRQSLDTCTRTWT